MQSQFQRLGGGIVVVVPGEVRHFARLAQQARDDIEELMGQEFFESAPFDAVSLVFTVGTHTCLKPTYRRIATYGGVRELPISVDLDISIMEKATHLELVGIFLQAYLEALLAVAEKYKLNAERLREARAKQPISIADSVSETSPAVSAATSGGTGSREEKANAAENNGVSLVSDGDPDDESVDEIPKLYRKSNGQTEYWETWEDDDHVIIHSGTLGDTGQSTELPRTPAVRRKVWAEAERRRSAGYLEIPDEELSTVIVQYSIEEFGSEADLDQRHEVEELLNDRLGWTGLGHVDGGDIGSGTMNIFCLVVDPEVAVPVIVRELEEQGHLEGVTIAVEGEETSDVRWPPDHQGEFSY